MSTSTITAGASTQLVPAGLSDHRPWAVYARKSRVGVGAFITKENQWAACTDYARAIAPGVELVYFFDNASGWDEEAKRPQWDLMLEGIAAGEYAGVVAWHVDRYTRQVSVGEHLWSLCKRARTQLHTKLGGAQTSALAFTVQNAVARDESDVKSERQKLKHAQLAKDGKPHGGRRAYGYNRERTALVPEEAAHVRWAADQVLAGRSIRSITAGLAERGAVTVSGQPWRASNLAVYLRRPMLAGLRVHHGKVVRDASWPALLEPGKWEAVRHLLENPSRRVSKRAARVYLLTGIARCGSCGGPMRGRSNASAGVVSAYFCGAQKGCAYRRSDLVDAQVRAEVISRLTQLDATTAMAAPVTDLEVQRAQLADQITQLEESLNGLVTMALRGAITPAMLETATAEATAQIAELTRQRGQLAVEVRRPSAVLSKLAGKANAAALFDALPLDEQKAVVAELCTVTILPSPGRGRVYDSELVQVQWLA